MVITTIQRLYSMLKGEPDLDPELEEESIFDTLDSPTDNGTINADGINTDGIATDVDPEEEQESTGLSDTLQKEPLPVVYNPEVPIELFDIIFVDECHRSIYSLWRQVLEYFDAHIIGLTATPAMQTFGFFHQNLVMEYNHENAVADGVNCDFEVYRILTEITSQGSTIEAGPGVQVGYRSRKTRQVRWQAPDEDISYDAAQVNRKVVAKDQIRLIIRTFKERLFTEIFPGREHVPKTVIFAIDDSHAEDIVETVREEFGEGADFCQKITYRTTGKDPKTLIKEFRNSYNPRIAVTVDMIATGTDIRPIEVVMFMRAVRSRVFFEQMKGRGVRIINPDDLQAVTPDAPTKDHFVIVDCVGVCQRDLSDSQPLERKRNISFKRLLELVSAGSTDEDVLSSLASRLSRLDKIAKPSEHEAIKATSGGTTLKQITNALVEAIDPDKRQDNDPKVLATRATKPLTTNPPLRKLLIDIKKRHEQIIDEISRDTLIDAGFSPQAKQLAQQIVQSFETFIEENKDEIDALQFFYTQPYNRRLHYDDIKALADAIGSPPRAWTPDTLWRAYATLEGNRVRGASSRRLLTDIVSLIRFALRKDDELIPFSDQVQERFQTWLLQQQNQGRTFTQDQIRWLEMIRDHIATSLEIEINDFDYTPFTEQGGLGRAGQVFGGELPKILKSLNEALAG